MFLPFPRPVVWSAAAFLLGMLCLMRPETAQAQVGNLGPGLFTAQAASGGRNAVGFALWYSSAGFHADAAPDDATNEERGYTDVLPGSITSRGPSLGISFRSWGLNIGFNEGEAPVESRADINQTPGNALDDPYVINVRRSSRTASIILNPLRWLFVGYGVESGSLEFTQVSAAGVGQTRKLTFSGGFYSMGLAAGFDPARGDSGLVFTLYAKVPAEPSPFSGTEFGAGLGVYL